MEIVGERDNNRRYRVETTQEYALWLNKFEKMLTGTERLGNKSLADKKWRKHYVSMINSLKKSMKTKQQCFIVESDMHVFNRYQIVMV